MSAAEAAFNEASAIAAAYFQADADRTETQFAKDTPGWGVWHSGGGCMVALRKVDDNHVLGVTAEYTCLYNVEVPAGEDTDAATLFVFSEDPWLVADNTGGGS